MAHFLFNCNLHHYTDVTGASVPKKPKARKREHTAAAQVYPKGSNQEKGSIKSPVIYGIMNCLNEREHCRAIGAEYTEIETSDRKE